MSVVIIVKILDSFELRRVSDGFSVHWVSIYWLFIDIHTPPVSGTSYLFCLVEEGPMSVAATATDYYFP